MNQCDFGLCCGSNGIWKISTWARDCSVKDKLVPLYNEEKFGTIPKDEFTGEVTITLEVSTDSSCEIVKGTITPKGGTPVGIEYKSDSLGDYFEHKNGQPKFRFMRFMSLVPKMNRPTESVWDTADGSYLYASMYNIKIDEQPWDQSLTQYAWSVQEGTDEQKADSKSNVLKWIVHNASDISLDSSFEMGVSDRIEIVHQYDYHNS